uniref:Uncharacterized protein n=1 Tax=viral metagenome TaxID=1070528 RepID=A0A6M3MD42_9ZZZZ
MGWHVHHIDGKFNIWSTVVDDYLLTEWVGAEIIEQVFVEKAIEKAKEAAKRDMEEARKGFCSVRLTPFKCNPEWCEQIRRENRER